MKTIDQPICQALLLAIERVRVMLIAERDCFYDGCTNQGGEYSDDEDRMAVDQYDRDIDELDALIKAARGVA